ncbi:MAG: helix-turn-helix transcriptional regulator [Ruminococcaceae bacterium]|nr:helix-turn-helix transcriptional regulator [Oscillospiraceae bacterium]
MCYDLSYLIQKLLILFHFCDIIISRKERDGKKMTIDILSDLVITKVYSVSTLYTPENTKLKRNSRERWAAVIKYEGETVYSSNGKRFLSDIEHIVILPKGCSYEWQCTRSGLFSIIEFESESTFYEPISFSVKNGEKILKKFKDLEYKRNLKRPTVELESIRDTYSILLVLMQAVEAQYLPTEKQQKIAPAVEYISQHYNENITNDELAAIAGMSTVYFRKLFTNIMGVSPITYVHQFRTEKAKEMLKSDYGTLSDVALSLGYSSLYDFSRDFKKHTGVAPSKY